MKAKLAAKLREYFSARQYTGFCHYLRDEQEAYDLLKKYAFEWPHSVKNHDGSDLDTYFVPAEIGNPSNEASCQAYNTTWEDSRCLRPRLDLANYILKRIAREQKKKFVPIRFVTSAATE